MCSCCRSLAARPSASHGAGAPRALPPQVCSSPCGTILSLARESVNNCCCLPARLACSLPRCPAAELGQHVAHRQNSHQAWDCRSYPGDGRDVLGSTALCATPTILAEPLAVQLQPLWLLLCHTGATPIHQVRMGVPTLGMVQQLLIHTQHMLQPLTVRARTTRLTSRCEQPQDPASAGCGCDDCVLQSVASYDPTAAFLQLTARSCTCSLCSPETRCL